MHVAVMAFSLVYCILALDSALPPNCIIYPTFPSFSCTRLHLMEMEIQFICKYLP